MQPFLLLGILALMVIMCQQIRGHFTNGPGVIPDLSDLISWGRLDFSASISGRFDLSDATSAVKALKGKTGDPVRLNLVP